MRRLAVILAAAWLASPGMLAMPEGRVLTCGPTPTNRHIDYYDWECFPVR